MTGAMTAAHKYQSTSFHTLEWYWQFVERHVKICVVAPELPLGVLVHILIVVLDVLVLEKQRRSASITELDGV